MTEQYQVPKNRLPARVHLADGDVRSVTLFVGDRAEQRQGVERPGDLLNEKAPFFPVEDDEEGFLLLRRAAVSVVTVDLEAEIGPDPTDPEDLALVDPDMEGVVQEDVRLVLDDGTEVRGTMALVLPPGERRLQDFLNQADRFVRVREEEQLHLVNTDRIARAAPE